MQFKKLFVFLLLLSGGTAWAQFYTCTSLGVSDVSSPNASTYVDANNDGCRDGNTLTVRASMATVLISDPSPLIESFYHRVKLEVYGTNTNNTSDATLVEAFEMRPDNYAHIDGNGDRVYLASWAFPLEPTSYEYFFVKLRVLKYTRFGLPGQYTYIPSTLTSCDSEVYNWCPGPPPLPDFKQIGHTYVNSTDDITYLPGVGTMAKLTPNSSFTYRIPCQNVGNTSAGSFRIETYVTDDNTFATSDISPGNAVGTPQVFSGLGAGFLAIHLQTDNVTAHPGKFSSAGSRYFHTYFDPLMTVTEGDEMNNLWTQRSYYFQSGTAGREGAITLSHLNTSNIISFVYLDDDNGNQQLLPTIGSGLSFSLFPAAGNGQLVPPAFQTTITSQTTTLDISSIPAGIYRVVLDNTFIKRIAVN